MEKSDLEELSHTLNKGFDEFNKGLDKIDIGFDEFNKGLDKIDIGLDKMANTLDRMQNNNLEILSLLEEIHNNFEKREEMGILFNSSGNGYKSDHGEPQKDSQ